ncbi:hypothetical protein [Vampirovibrio sp.]|uniref:hypothetical protein n=1 Tax=Vampirovibrio sp. TaxID=2717857 RepID=UPI00359363DB
MTDSRREKELDLREPEQLPVISQSLEDWGQPGVMVEVDLETAETMGAFVEDALSSEDAWESSFDSIQTQGERHE